MAIETALLAAFSPIGLLTAPTAQTVDTTPIRLFADLTDGVGIKRRVYVVNTHATQSLAIFTRDKSTTLADGTVVTTGGVILLPAGARDSFLFESNVSLRIVGSGVGTTFSACASDK